VKLTRAILLCATLAFLCLGVLVRAKTEQVGGFLVRHRRTIEGMLTSAVTLVLLLAVLEAAARVVLRGQTSELGGAAYKAQLARLRYNSFGLRDREFSVDKPRGTVRIIALGDSFTFGHGIENEAAPWPKVLESLLNAAAPVGTRYEVINAGQNGFGTADELARLKETLVFRPDAVILGYFFNDAETDDMILHRSTLTTLQRFAYGAHFFLFGHSYLYGLVVVRWEALKINCGFEKSAPQQWNEIYGMKEQLNIHKQQLLQMREIAVAAQASFVIVTIPGNYDFAHYPLRVGHAFMRAFCAEQQLACIDPLPVFAGQDYTRTRLNPYDAHPSEYGHRLLAETIYNSPVFREALPHP